MGNILYKRLNISFSSNSIKKKNVLYINNIPLRDAFEIFDSESSQFSQQILLNIMISGIAVFCMAQIAISARPENAEYVDKLQSYKDIKRKCISGTPGRTASAVIGIAISFPYLMQDHDMQGDDFSYKLGRIAIDLVENPSPNTRRIKPSTSEWQNYAKGEMGAANGQLLSCPSTNIKVLNIDGQKILNYDLSDSITAIGISEDILKKYGINTEIIKNEFKSIFLIDNNGMPINKIIYDEPESINSHIQSEIFGDLLMRTGKINSNLVKGMEPYSYITKAQVEKHLNKYELIAYNFAIKSGDKNILKKYTELVKERSKSK